MAKLEKGVTLIAVIVTVIILIILATVSIAFVIGDDGIVNRALEEKQTQQVVEEKQIIQDFLLSIQIDKITNLSNKEEIKELIDKLEEHSKELNIIEIEKIDDNKIQIVTSSNNIFQIVLEEDTTIQVIHIGKVEQPNEQENEQENKQSNETQNQEKDNTITQSISGLELEKDETQSGVSKVIITATANIEEGTINKIIKPDNTEETGSTCSYTVTQNGEYTFSAVTQEGKTITKTVIVNNIKPEGIDITNISEDTQEAHVCEFEKNYDSNYHWEQCNICEKVTNKTNHILTTMGIQGCAPKYGYQYITCECGYSKRLDKQEHTDNGQWLPAEDRAFHYQYCTECNNTTHISHCYNSEGKTIGCTGVSGNCVICGQHRENNQHSYFESYSTSKIIDGNTTTITGYIACSDCRKRIATYNEKLIKTQDTEYKVEITYTIFDDNFVVNEKYKISSYSGICEDLVSQNIDGTDKQDSTYQVNYSFAYNKENLAPNTYDVYILAYGTYNEYNTYIHLGDTEFKADSVEPRYIEANIEYANQNGDFATKATITAKYLEEYDDICYIRLLNSDKTSIISDWEIAERSATIFTKTIELTDEVNGAKTIYLQAKDSSGNKTKLQPIEVLNIDNKAPQMTSNKEFISEWTRTKQVKIDAKETGSGKVEIAFNNTSEFQEATLAESLNSIYTKEYVFTGDVYENKTEAIYLKDALGNINKQKITIGKIDNTSPTITRVTKRKTDAGTIVTIIANDKNINLDQEGSGIVGYAITKSKEEPTNDKYQASEILTVQEVGRYYIYAKDAVGNISTKYEINVE